ncbi:MAG TPA: SPOR domain-containing protein [Thermoanaerobaculia bacterium]|nr:SPOR domain-containing protein [Thermoanaerobaculia bacterium]
MDGTRTEMTSSHEPSYYEIALTNRQVVVAFVILLVCLVSAFFSGMWIGRESSTRAAEQIASNPAPAQEKQEGQSLEEFEFFEKPQAKGQDTPAEPETQQSEQAEDTTLLEDFGGDDDAAADDAGAADDEPVQKAAPRPTPQPRPAAPAADERAENTKKDESVVRSRPLPEATPSKTAQAAPPSGSGRAGDVVIQVFSSPEQDQAERIQARLARGGHKAFLSPVEVAGRTMYRVRIGPFNSRDEAQRVAEQVRKGYKLDTWVTE